ncbi:hypothetical protein BJY04DRAFT_136156 [Aspergillus karnatakaensis]|uniref:uncharacterized protein n=1 Tax=Aspergillus karnatakaensis TaxID=1810916 RepID=UPI003CCD7A32
MSFSRFRKPNQTKPLYNQRTGGDISIPIPKDIRTAYKSSRITPSCEDDDIIPLTGSSTSSTSSTSSRRDSFTMKTLNPRRLSLRLKSRASNPTSPSTPEHKPTDYRTHTEAGAGIGGGRADFIYKPITRQDYPTVVAETAASQSRPVSRYQYHYIPSTRGERYMEEPSRSRAHYTHTLDDEDRLDRRGRDLYNDLDEEYERNLGGAPWGGYTTSESDIYTSAAEKRRSRAARRLTTVMVPDADEIYG